MGEGARSDGESRGIRGGGRAWEHGEAGGGAGGVRGHRGHRDGVLQIIRNRFFCGSPAFFRVSGVGPPL